MWENWAQATCVGNGYCTCEVMALSEWVRQPQATVSTLFLFGVGVWAFGVLRMRSWGIALMASALGSAFFHMSLTKWGEIADFATIVALSSYLAVSRRRILGWGVGLVVSSLLIWFLPVLRAGIAFAVGGFAVWKLMRSELRTQLLPGLGLAGVGALIFVLDRLGIGCNLPGGLHGHTIWHGLAAAGLAQLTWVFHRRGMFK